MSKLRKTISANLLRFRETRGMSQSELAKASGLMPSAVAHFEAGRRMPNFENLLKLSNALDVTIDSIFGRQTTTLPAGPLALQIIDSIKKMDQRDIEMLALFARLNADGNQRRVARGGTCPRKGRKARG